MLKRKIWSKLEDFKANANKKTLLLTGARQVGKTYIVEQFAKARYKSFVEINFVEDAAAKAIFHDVADEKDVLRRITAYAQGKVIPGETLVLFDEVQECPEAVTYANNQRPYLCAFLEHGEVDISNNLAENAILNYASRVYGSEDSSAEKDYTLYPCDLKIPEQTDSQLEDHVHIGFVA